MTRSLWLCCLNLGVHGLAVFVIATNELISPELTGPLFLALLLSGYREGTRWLLWRGDAICKLRRVGDAWYLVRVDGRWQRMQLVSPGFVSPFLIALKFRVAGQGPEAVLVAADACDPVEFRHLGVLLNVRAGKLFGRSRTLIGFKQKPI